MSSSSKVAVIIEPRKHEALYFVIHNVATKLPDFHIQLFHGTFNEEYVKLKLNTFIASGKVSLHSLGVPNLTFPQYNRLLLSVGFWNQVQGENVLIFQTDSMILDQTTYTIDNFLGYDYVGAPWAWSKNRKLVGNGGFSLRKKSSSLVAVRSIKDPKVRAGSLNEDVYFSNFFTPNPHYKVAPWDVAKNFSVETVYNKSPFGIHKPWGCKQYLGTHYDQLLKDHPEINTLVRLQSGSSSTPKSINKVKNSNKVKSILKIRKARLVANRSIFTTRLARLKK